MPFSKDLLVFDLECTGTDPGRYNICQIGALLVCGRCLRAYMGYGTIVRPLRPEDVDEKAMAVHGIPMETLMKGTPLEAMLADLEEMCAPEPKEYLPSSWGSFDTIFLRASYSKVARVFPFTWRSFDMKSAVIWEVARRKDLTATTGGVTKFSRLLGVPWEGKPHDALADAHQELRLLQSVWPKLRCKKHDGMDEEWTKVDL